jgi:O-succinylbenzoic acid--CoA ligase
MLDWLSISVRANPNNLALLYEHRQWTYRELDREVNAVCGWLSTQGVKPGMHIGVLMHNRPEYVFLIHALMRLGAVLIPLNTRLTPAEISDQVERVKCRLVIYSPETQDTARTLNAVPVLPMIIGDLTPSMSIPARELDLDALQAIIFTSGTSGKPKGAMLTYNNHFWGATASAFRLGTLPEDRWLCCLPLYHVGGLNIVMRCCIYGTTVVLQRGFEVESVLSALATQAVSLVSLVPTMLYRLLHAIHPSQDTPFHAPHLRLILLGGAAATPELMERCLEVGIPVSTTYGLTEADSQVATQSPGETLRKPGSVGKPLPYVQVRLVDDTGLPVQTGEIGEIMVQSQTIMKGYFDDFNATVRVLRDGWLSTGDLGYLDSDGDLWVVQRRSDLIVSGGENIYPAEVEAVLRRHPAVSDACVVGIPDAEWGQKVAAAVMLHTGHPITADALLTFSRETLAGFKVPRLVRFVDTLPMTASGKIQRDAVLRLFNL